MARKAAAGSLAAYRAKRNFAITGEPRGKRATSRGRRFVVQKHDATRLHYDFRLELDGVLKSWAVTRGPSLNPADKRLAVRTEDHPVAYGDFEGTIPAGQYGGGTVMLWDVGTWTPVGDPRKALRDGKLRFQLDGERLKGEWTLVRMKGGALRADRKRENWLLIKADDAAAHPRRDILSEFTTSAATGRSLGDIAKGNRVWTSPRAEDTDLRPRKNQSRGVAGKPSSRGRPRRAARLPAFVEPALCTLVEKPPQGEGWLFEMKFDGYRAQIAADGEAVRIYTRRGLDWTDRFGAIAQAARERHFSGVLIDGEIVVLDAAGHSDFGALQTALDGRGGALSYFAFDLLAEDHRPLIKMPLAERKARLRGLIGAGEAPLFFSDHVENGGAMMLEKLCAQGFEGIVAKRAAASYRSGRGRDWLKVKCGNRQEFVIGGFSASDKDRPFRSLLLGVFERGDLRYKGRVGSGFSQATLRRLAQDFRRLARKSSPFHDRLPRVLTKDATWVDPKLVAEIEFAGFTRDDLVRHARFVGLREDKPAKEIRMEKTKPLADLAPKAAKKAGPKAGPAPSPASAKAKADPAGRPALSKVRLTHPQKLLYPDEGISKEEVAAYLAAVGPLMLPFVKNRLVSLVRCPEGRNKPCFFQRHVSPGMPETFHRLSVREKAGDKDDYIYLDNLEGLAACAQIGALEIHVWGSRIEDIERPDRLVFDFDPADDVPFSRVKEAAHKMREALQALDLASFPLLTGGKGIHVVVPIRPDHSWPVAKAFARALAEHFAEHEPDRYVATMAKAKRSGRIFIDHFRNERGSTAIAPFSPRARPGAPVAWPLDWDGLKKAKAPNTMTVRTAIKALPKTVWPGYGRIKQSISESALKALGVDRT